MNLFARFLSKESQRRNALRKASLGVMHDYLAIPLPPKHAPYRNVDIVALDLETTGLDPQARHLLWDRLYRLKQQGVTLIITTHYMDEAEHCHRLAFIQHGKIIALGTPTTIKAAGSLLFSSNSRVKAPPITPRIIPMGTGPILLIARYGSAARRRI